MTMLSEKFCRKYKKDKLYSGALFFSVSLLDLFLSYVFKLTFVMWVSGFLSGLALVFLLMALSPPRLTLLEWVIETEKNKPKEG